MLAVVSPFLSRPCVDVGGELCPVLRLRPLHGSRQHGIDQPADRSRQGGLASDVAGVASAGRNSSKVSMVVTGTWTPYTELQHLGSIHFREHAGPLVADAERSHARDRQEHTEAPCRRRLRRSRAGRWTGGQGGWSSPRTLVRDGDDDRCRYVGRRSKIRRSTSFDVRWTPSANATDGDVVEFPFNV